MRVTVLAGMILLLAAPAYANDHCVDHFCSPEEWTRAAEVPNWWTSRGTGTYWDWNAPTMADAPSWLKRRTRRHELPGNPHSMLWSASVLGKSKVAQQLPGVRDGSGAFLSSTIWRQA